MPVDNDINSYDFLKGRSADLNIFHLFTTYTHGQTILVNNMAADNDINCYDFLKGRSADLNILHLSTTYTHVRLFYQQHVC